MGLTKPRAYQIFDIDYKQAVRVIALTNITLTGGAPSTVDGVSLAVNDRILVAGQSTGSQNGLYQVSVLGTGSNGTWVRSVDTNESGELNAGTIVMVTEGTTYKDTQWKLTTNDPIVIGTTDLVFEQNSAFAFGNIWANSTAVLADIVGDTVTFTPANNMVILANATSDTITFEVSQNPNFTGNFVVSGTVGSNLIPTANIVYNLGNSTNRWNDIWLANSTIYLGNARLSANTTSLILTNPQGAQTVFSGTTANLSADTITATGNVSANYFLGNVACASGIFTTKIFNGNSEANIVSSGGNLEISIGGTSDIVIVTSTGLQTSGTLSATGNITGGNLITSGLVSVTGNVNAGAFSTAGNISGGNILGNGRNLSGIETFRSFAVAAGNTIVADSINDTFTFSAGSGITLVADPTTDTLTIAAAGQGSEIFVDGADFGTVAEVVTTSDDLGLVTEAVTSQADLGEIVISGVFYPTQLVIPTYTVSTLPSAAIPAQMIYVSNESGGAVPAFSDGTNWRRVTDRAIVT